MFVSAKNKECCGSLQGVSGGITYLLVACLPPVRQRLGCIHHHGGRPVTREHFCVGKLQQLLDEHWASRKLVQPLCARLAEHGDPLECAPHSTQLLAFVLLLLLHRGACRRWVFVSAFGEASPGPRLLNTPPISIAMSVCHRRSLANVPGNRRRDGDCLGFQLPITPLGVLSSDVGATGKIQRGAL